MPNLLLLSSQKKLALSCCKTPLVPANRTEPAVALVSVVPIVNSFIVSVALVNVSPVPAIKSVLPMWMVELALAVPDDKYIKPVADAKFCPVPPYWVATAVPVQPPAVTLPDESMANTVVELVFTSSNKLPVPPQIVSLEYGVEVPIPIFPPSKIVNTSSAPSKMLTISPVESCLTDSRATEEEAWMKNGE